VSAVGIKFLLQCEELSSHFADGCSMRAVLLEFVAVDQKIVALHSKKNKILELHYNTFKLIQAEIQLRRAPVLLAGFTGKEQSDRSG
jgi:hypothetical protein